MFDNLRQQSAREAGMEEEESTGPIIQPMQSSAAPAAAPRRSRGFLGLTPFQRFFLALMLFLFVVLLGCSTLIVFERVALPF